MSFAIFVNRSDVALFSAFDLGHRGNDLIHTGSLITDVQQARIDALRIRSGRGRCWLISTGGFLCCQVALCCRHLGGHSSVSVGAALVLTALPKGSSDLPSQGAFWRGVAMGSRRRPCGVLRRPWRESDRIRRAVQGIRCEPRARPRGQQCEASESASRASRCSLLRRHQTAPTRRAHAAATSGRSEMASNAAAFVGERAGDRTPDRRIKSPLLYQLSYAPGRIVAAPPGHASEVRGPRLGRRASSG